VLEHSPGAIRDTTGEYTIAWLGAVALFAVAAAVPSGSAADSGR
jgi:hypothetical protein